MQGKRFLPTLGDCAVYALVLLTAAVFFFLFLPHSTPESARVVRIQSGEKVECYDLDTDREISVEGEGGFTLTLSVSSGTVRVVQASCRDHLCVKTGAISKEGRSIICLPARVIITIEGGDGSDEDVFLP